jgi:hypothetical protein
MLHVLEIKLLCSMTLKSITIGIHIGTLLHLYTMWRSVAGLPCTHDARDRFFNEVLNEFG